jgi:hypothetical protein
MRSGELKKAIKAKTIEFETAMELGKPRNELLKIYKELKELRYGLVKFENQLEAFQS